MKFIPAELDGAFVVEMERREDERGFFGRYFCAREFESHGVAFNVAQCNIGFSHKKGTLRGLHYQESPAEEAKLIRCTRGAIYDVIVDVRRESRTYLRHISVELTAENQRAFLVPPMCAHGYQTLSDQTEVTYLVNQFYNAKHERGIRHDDPALGIRWPLPVAVISAKDKSWPLLKAELTAADKRS